MMPASPKPEIVDNPLRALRHALINSGVEILAIELWERMENLLDTEDPSAIPEIAKHFGPETAVLVSELRARRAVN
jgi:hypothetical protein